MPGPKLITELPEVVGFTNSHLIAVGDPNTGTLYKTTIDFITVGPQGNQGSIGATGIQGNIGLQGSQGFQGRQGNFGATGFQGLQGNQGWQGFQGLQGLQGRQGSGVTGSQGWQGSQGNIGNQGDVGERGFQGNDGLNGTGEQGFQGNQGFIGGQGFQGRQGSGVAGDQGSQGFQGNQGWQGYGSNYSSTSSTTFMIPITTGTTQSLTVGTNLAYTFNQTVVIQPYIAWQNSPQYTAITKIYVNLFNSSNQLVDGVVSTFYQSYTDAIDQTDVTKSSSGLSIYYPPSTYLSIEKRSTVTNPIQYRISGINTSQTYYLSFPISNFNPSFKAYLYDSLLGLKVPITTTTAPSGSEQIGLTYSFTWNGPSDELRFSLIITPPDLFYGNVDSYNPSTGVLNTTCVSTTATQSFTYSYWQANLSGAPGIKGVTGVSGSQGYQGTQGNQGIMGYQGPQINSQVFPFIWLLSFGYIDLNLQTGTNLIINGYDWEGIDPGSIVTPDIYNMVLPSSPFDGQAIHIKFNQESNFSESGFSYITWSNGTVSNNIIAGTLSYVDIPGTELTIVYSDYYRKWY